MRRLSTWVVLVLVLAAAALASCAGDADARDAAAPDAHVAHVAPRTIDEGDWFSCADEACSELKPVGVRFASHELIRLHAAEQPDGHFSEGDSYCVGERFGTYVLEGTIVTLILHDGGLSVQSDFVIDDAGLTAHGGDIHKVEENATGRWADDVCVSD